MQTPAKPTNEEARLRSLRELQIINNVGEKAYDDIVHLASYICETPMAFVSFIEEEEQWFKAKKNLNVQKSSRDESFCGHAILNPNGIFEVENSTLDSRFKDNPFATSSTSPIIFYAAVPILDEKGYALGTLCVADSHRKKLSPEQKDALKRLGNQVEILIEAHRKNQKLEKLGKELDESNKVLREFASTVSHDLKMPLANMIITADMLKAKYAKHLDNTAKNYLKYLKQSGLTLSEYINSLLDHYSNNHATDDLKQEFFVNDLLEDIIDLLQIDDHCEINLPDNNLRMYGNSAALGQIFMNLISNSIKYNDNEKIEITISCSQNPEFYTFSIQDNGIGIPLEKQDDIFKLFATIADKDRRGKKGHGIGLSTVKKLVNRLGGSILVTSEEHKGTNFEFSVKR